MNRKQLFERDICTKFITPALERAGWEVATQIREEFPLTKGRVVVRGKLQEFADSTMPNMAPPADRVPKLMADLLEWLETTDEHPLVASCVFSSSCSAPCAIPSARP